MSKLVLGLYSPAHIERYAIKIKDDDYTRQILSAFLLVNWELIRWIQLSAVTGSGLREVPNHFQEAINRSSPPAIVFNAAALKIKVTSLRIGTKCTNGYRKFWYLWLGTGNSACPLVNDGNENVAGKKDRFAFFQTLSHLFRPIPFVKCGRFFLEFNP